MLKVNKGSEPDIFSAAKKSSDLKTWDELEPEVKYHLKQYMLAHEQSYNGTQLCPYCERKITAGKGHIEHIKPT